MGAKPFGDLLKAPQNGGKKHAKKHLCVTVTVYSIVRMTKLLKPGMNLHPAQVSSKYSDATATSSAVSCIL